MVLCERGIWLLLKSVYNLFERWKNKFVQINVVYPPLDHFNQFNGTYLEQLVSYPRESEGYHLNYDVLLWSVITICDSRNRYQTFTQTSPKLLILLWHHFCSPIITLSSSFPLSCLLSHFYVVFFILIL